MPATLSTTLILPATTSIQATASLLQQVATDSLLFSPADFATSPVFLVHDPLSTTIRLVSSLLLVLALIFAVSWLIQRKVGLGSSNFGKVLGIMPLDSKRFIYVVDILNRLLVLGVTEQQISLLCEITDKATIDALRLTGQSNTTPGIENLFGFLKHKRGEEITPEELAKHTETAQNNRQKIQDLLLRKQQEQREDRPPEP